MIGILGGMGPYATIAFYQKILELTDAKKDSDHIHTWIDSNTKIPSRNRHFIYNEHSPVDGMIESIKKMKQIGIREVYIPCNSASYFIPEIEKEITDIDIVGTIDVTINYILEQFSNKKCMVLGAFIVYNKEPYREKLEDKGFEYVRYDKEIQKDVETLIYGIKDNNINQNLLNSALKLYRKIISKYDIDILVLGCTELCIVFDKLENLDTVVVDTNQVLANYVVRENIDAKQ